MRTSPSNGRRCGIPDQALAIIRGVPRRNDRGRLFGDGPGPFSGWSKAKAALDKRILEARQEAAKQARRPAKDVQAIEPWTVHDPSAVRLHRHARAGGRAPHRRGGANHISGHRAGVAGTYNHALYAAQKRDALVRWGEHVRSVVAGEAGKILPFRGRDAG